MRISRGEIYFIKRGNQYQGNEIAKDRPGVIVSAEHLNAGERFVEVVYLTTQPKREMLEHVPILSSGRCSTALCEQINSVSIERLGNFYGRVSPSEMRDIDKALANSLGLGQELCGGGVVNHMEKIKNLLKILNTRKLLTSQKLWQKGMRTKRCMRSCWIG